MFILIVVILFYIKNDMEKIYNKNLLSTNTECYIDWRSKKTKANCELIKNILNDKNNKWKIVFDYHKEPILSTKILAVSFLKNSEYIMVDYKDNLYGWINVISDKEFKNFREKSEIIDINKELNKKIESNLKN